VNWEFRRTVLTVDSPRGPLYYRTDLDMAVRDGEGRITAYCNIERPKVLFNRQTGKFVMWMHYENGLDYSAARCAVATCDTPDGAYVYHGSFNPCGQMSRDCTLFLDDDGTAYFLSAARDNADLNLYRLSADYLSVDAHIRTLWPDQYREAPAVVKHGGLYYIVTSGCTGWPPNQGMYSYASDLAGPWSVPVPLGDETTYDSQPAFILPVEGPNGRTYLLFGDRWDPCAYERSSYVVLPLAFDGPGRLRLEWQERVAPDGTGMGGQMRTSDIPEGRCRLRGHRPDRYLAAGKGTEGAGPAWAKLSYGDESLVWQVVREPGDSITVRHEASGLYLSAAVAEAGGYAVELDPRACEWKLHRLEGRWVKLVHAPSGLALTGTGEEGLGLSPLVAADTSRWLGGYRYGMPDPQAFLAAPVRNRISGPES